MRTGAGAGVAKERGCGLSAAELVHREGVEKLVTQQEQGLLRRHLPCARTCARAWMREKVRGSANPYAQLGRARACLCSHSPPSVCCEQVMPTETRTSGK